MPRRDHLAHRVPLAVRHHLVLSHTRPHRGYRANGVAVARCGLGRVRYPLCVHTASKRHVCVSPSRCCQRRNEGDGGGGQLSVHWQGSMPIRIDSRLRISAYCYSDHMRVPVVEGWDDHRGGFGQQARFYSGRAAVPVRRDASDFRDLTEDRAILWRHSHRDTR